MNLFRIRGVEGSTPLSDTFFEHFRGRFYSYIFGVSGKIFYEIFRLRVSVITIFRKKSWSRKKYIKKNEEVEFFLPETPVKHVLSTFYGGLGEKFAFIRAFFVYFPTALTARKKI